jgi:hypothetical protein
MLISELRDTNSRSDGLCKGISGGHHSKLMLSKLQHRADGEAVLKLVGDTSKVFQHIREIANPLRDNVVDISVKVNKRKHALHMLQVVEEVGSELFHSGSRTSNNGALWQDVARKGGLNLDLARPPVCVERHTQSIDWEVQPYSSNGQLPVPDHIKALRDVIED